ncbi:hypothetical protein [Bryocella elongata]|uniref:hypothetical protein n=1 Tax=Bryocella elongata TaxID=863522 RepID=UPI0011B00D5D|nr:hypothetical protein [Bryocella elongata]
MYFSAGGDGNVSCHVDLMTGGESRKIHGQNNLFDCSSYDIRQNSRHISDSLRQGLALPATYDGEAGKGSAHRILVLDARSSVNISRRLKRQPGSARQRNKSNHAPL